MTRATAEAHSLPRLTRNRLTRLAPVVIGLCLLGLVFRPEIGAAVHVWVSSTAYNHCFLVLPIALWLAWDRRSSLVRVAIQPAPWALVVAIPLGLAWFVADRLGIMEGRQLAAMGFVQLLFLATLGWRMWRAAAAPLLYLFFLVPFGAFVTPALQGFTVRFVVAGLNLLGVPNFTDGYTIDIPEGSFYIAEACAGLRFLIAAVAFGVLYASMMYRSALRRLTFIAVSTVVPIIANGVRALGIVLLGHALGSAEAAATDHVLYGWVFFSILILILIVLGLPFRQDQGATQSTTVASLQAAQPERAAVLAVLLAAIALAGPAAAAAIGRTVPPAMPVPLNFATPTGCAMLPGQNAPATQHFVCDGLMVLASAELFPPGTAPGDIRARIKQLTEVPGGEDGATGLLHIATPRPLTWERTETNPPLRAVAVLVWMDGHPASDAWRGRAGKFWRSLVGNRTATAVVSIVIGTGRPATQAEAKRVRRVQRQFLEAQSALPAKIARLASMARVR